MGENAAEIKNVIELEDVVKNYGDFVFDEMGFHDFMTAKQINTMMKNVYKNWHEETFFAYLKRFALPTNKRCGSFSRGMQMKLQIATALSREAKLLIMDEPTRGLDPVVRSEMLQIFREFVIEEDHTILLSSHITSDLEKLADEVVFINGGRIVLCGNKDELLEKYGMIRCRKSDLQRIDSSLIVSAESSDYGTEILINDRAEARRRYPDMVIEAVGLEDIMLYYVKRSQE
ncbi:MAG: ATP-binding cassette domain-containing protein [Agathobacter sp.]